MDYNNSENTEKKIDYQRIYYVEPNDVFDEKDKQITPSYEDFCISFNLIITQYERLKKSFHTSSEGEEEEGKKEYIIRWGKTKKEMEASSKYGSVLQGKRSLSLNNETKKIEPDDKYNYLTTYYTDISHDSYKEGTEIEGLGVESVQISYESWYTPTVVIKFVDVRGSALFGREEAIHIGENLQAENLFGAFFTMPYPLFRLQVKGFLGKPVTYQLCCSNFKGEFNSTTGNFEATATFLGYSWSLMTDIPFLYLVAAPYATYIGHDYWERHKNSEEWGLWDGNNEPTLPPPTLYDFTKNIDAAQNKTDFNGSAEQREEQSSIENELTILSSIKENIAEFEKQFEALVNNNFLNVEFDNTDKKKQILLFSKASTVTVTDVAKEAYKNLYSSLKEYEEGGYSTAEIGTDKMPNGWVSKEFTDNNMTFYKRFINDSSKKIKALNNNNEVIYKLAHDNFSEITYNGTQGKLCSAMVQKLIETINNNNNNGNNNGVICEYCNLIDFSNLYQLAEDAEKDRNNRKIKLAEEIQSYANENIVELLNGSNGEGGFKPYIGNVYKIIMCHLETFCHIMFDSAEEIKKQYDNGERTAAALGIRGANANNGNQTPTEDKDFPSTDLKKSETNNNIVAWPALFGTQTKSCGYVSDLKNVYGWPGDSNIVEYPAKFIEVKVVYALQEGVQMLAETREQLDTGTTIYGFPITPSDFIINGTIFSKANINNYTDLSGYLAIRMTNIIGVMCGNNISDTLAEEIGRMDSYNLYLAWQSAIRFKEITKGMTVDYLRDIMYSIGNDAYNAYGIENKREGTYRFQFETQKKIKYNEEGRHPFFKDENNKARYIHFYDGNDVAYTPAVLKAFKFYAGTAEKLNYDFYYDTRSQSGPFFRPNFTDADVFNEDPEGPEYDGKTQSTGWLYTARDTDIDYALFQYNASLHKYNNQYMCYIVTDESKIKGIKSKYDEIKSNKISIADDNVTDDFTEFLNTFYKIGEEEKTKYLKPYRSILNYGLRNIFKFNTAIVEDVVYEAYQKVDVYNSNGWKLRTRENEVKDMDISKAVIDNFFIYYKGYTGVNLFTCPFYYVQNSITDDDIKLKVKALLFLHTFLYTIEKNGHFIHLNIFSNDKKTGCIEEVPKAYLLLIGGLLWRQRQDNDPIRFSEDNLTFQSCDKNHTLFHLFKNANGTYGYYMGVCKEDQNDFYNVSIKTFVGDTVDFNVGNQLISLFEDFAKTTFNDIANNYELKNTTTNKDKRITVDYKGKSFIADFKAYYDEMAKMKKDQTHLKNILNQKTGDGFWMRVLENVEYLRYAVPFVDLFNWGGSRSSAQLKSDNYKKLVNEYKKISEKLETKSFVSLQAIINGEKGTSNFVGKYFLCDILKEQDYSAIAYLNTVDQNTQNILKDLYLETYLICDGCYTNSSTAKKHIYLNKNLMTSYLKGFVDSCNKITGQEVTSISDGTETFEVSEQTLKNKDLSIAIYYYLKNLWDKWLITSNTDEFDVSNFFDENFIFIDSFYKNTYNALAINCEEFLQTYTGLSKEGSLFNFLADICAKHRCIFLPVPDFVGFNGKKEQDIEAMKQLFRPIPYNSMDGYENNNKFIVMYTYPPSSKKDESNGYYSDSYDLFKNKCLTTVAEALFSKTDCVDGEGNTHFDKSEKPITRYGYNVPSFGVSFGRQNNHIFKSLKLSMENPIMTEQAMKAQWNICLKAGNSQHTIAFIGQDTFNVFCNYSYTITIEMMGNAQIAPLMYFQLTNVPLWSGTYMIFKVTHSMTPGNMTTTITAMKMAKFATPFNEKFFIINPVQSISSDGSGYSNDCVGDATDYDTEQERHGEKTSLPMTTKIGEFYTLRELTITNCEDNVPGTRDVERLKLFCKDIIDPLRKECNNQNITFSFTSVYRTLTTNKKCANSKVSTSDHLYGLAADIQTGNNSKSDTLKLLNLIKKMICDGKLTEVRQLIFETKKCETYWVHIARRRPEIENDKKNEYLNCVGNNYTKDTNNCQ